MQTHYRIGHVALSSIWYDDGNTDKAAEFFNGMLILNIYILSKTYMDATIYTALSPMFDEIDLYKKDSIIPWYCINRDIVKGGIYATKANETALSAKDKPIFIKSIKRAINQLLFRNKGPALISFGSSKEPLYQTDKLKQALEPVAEPIEVSIKNKVRKLVESGALLP